MVKRGEELLNKAVESTSIEITPDIIDKMLDYYQRVNKEDLYYAIGSNEISLPQKIEKLLTLKSDNLLLKYMKQALQAVKKSDSKERTDKATEYELIDPKKTYVLEEDSFNKNFKMMSCCNPIPGDNIFGYLTDTNEVEIHSIHCPVGLKLKASHGNKIVNLEWGSYTQFPFVTSITVTGIDRMGMLNDITKVITAGSLNIKNMSIESNDGVFEGHIVVNIHDVNDLQMLCSHIAKIKGVKTVNRKQS
jgi:GTP pyrophosphokinase